MTEKATGGSGQWEHVGGMTLRDYFAGQALAGFCANQHKHDRAKDHSAVTFAAGEGKTIAEILTKESYRYADEMLKERGE